MLGLILRIIALLCFILGAANQTLFGQPELDLYGWGLAAWVLATLVGGYGPPVPTFRRPAA